MEALHANGAPVVEIGKNPVLPEDPGLCLTRPGANPSACIGKMASPAVDAAEKATLESMGGTYLDIDSWFCADHRCPPIIDNVIVYRDHDHLEPHYVTTLAPVLTAALQSSGLR